MPIPSQATAALVAASPSSPLSWLSCARALEAEALGLLLGAVDGLLLVASMDVAIAPAIAVLHRARDEYDCSRRETLAVERAERSGYGYGVGA
jgi:hypothetical protein